MTKEAAHTPGPWVIFQLEGELIVVPAGRPGEIAFIKSEKQADADLIAAAPDLLTELRSALQHIKHMAAWIGKQNAGYSFEILGEDMPGIRAAIAKATGTTP